MEEEDLRIGNWVKFNGLIGQMTGGNFFKFGETMKNGVKPLDYFKIKPIPLTEEWLLRFGCRKINNSMFKLGAFTFQGSTINDGGDLVNKMITSIKSYKICYQGKFLTNKEFVHEWQNLYFSLTGE